MKIIKKKKGHSDKIILGEKGIKKITSSIFFNLDYSLAILIRDLLKQYLKEYASFGCPGNYSITENGKEISVKEGNKLWKADIEKTIKKFDKYINEDFSTDSEVQDMFFSLAKIFGGLWI